MRKLGKSEPRELNALGVSGLLLEGCGVLTSAVFSTRDLGRVSDLIVARLKDTGMDELRARALLLFSIFEASACQREVSIQSGQSDGDVSEPMQVECGSDPEKIAIGISFRSLLKPENFEGLAERVVRGEPADAFESLIQELYRHSDRLLIRFIPENVTEIVSLIAIEPAIAEDPEGKPAPMVMELPPESQEKGGPAAGNITDLGDLDYAGLLAGGTKALESAGEEESEKRFSAEPREREAVEVVKGASESEEESSKRISGSPEERGGDTLVKGGQQAASDGDVVVSSDDPGKSNRAMSVRVPGASEAPPSEDPRIAAYLQRINELAEKVRELESRPTSKTASSEDSSGSDSEVLKYGTEKKRTPVSETSDSEAPASAEGSAESESGGLQGLIQKIWPFNRKKRAETTDGEPQNPLELPAAPEEGSDDPEKDGLVSEISRGSLERALAKAKAELEHMKASKETPLKTQRWVEGMVSELIAEKARLSELAKENNILVRRKELEYRKREAILTQQLQKRNEEFRQKETALINAKEQLNIMTRKLEAAQAGKKEMMEEEGLKQKYAESQRLLGQAKDDVSRLTKKLNEMKNQLNSMNMSLKMKSSGPNQADFTALKGNYEKVQRQADQFRDENVTLRDKVAELTEKLKDEQTRSGGPGDAKRLSTMLDQATKSYTAAKRDAEQFKKASLEKDRELSKLKVEIKQLRYALNQAKPGSAGSGGNGGKAA